MRLKGSSYYLIVIMTAMLVIMISALTMKRVESRLLPLIIGGVVLALAGIRLWQEILAEAGSGTTVADAETDGGEEARESWRGYLPSGVWIVGFFLAVYLLGFMIAIPLFTFGYMKSHGVRWLISIILTTVVTVTEYSIFQVVLRVELYRGLLFTWLGS